jgi:hypothetical protein
MKAHVSNNSFIWVKADSGNLYVCRTDALADPKHASEEELRKHCMDGSERPDNS